MKKPYVVSFGRCHEDERAFATFDEAQSFYAAQTSASIHNRNRCDADVGGEGNMVFVDGLTDDERERI